MVRPVVVAVDGSDESLCAAEWAAREAVRRAAPLRIVSAPGLLPRMRGNQAPVATVANALRGIAARALADAVDRVNEVAAGVLVDTDLIDGPPAAAVRDSGTGALLLVVGARGAGGFAALVLGSVSRYAAAHAPCPVVVVHEETRAVHREIVVGVRDPDAADAALKFAFEEAALRASDLIVLHATSWSPAPGAAPHEDAAREEKAPAAAADRHLENVLDKWRRKFPDVMVTPDVARGHPAHLLASLSTRADMVIIGRRDTAGTPGCGTVRHSLLGHAHGPVVVVPSISPE
jgi:nucleotide-binding universal stress UspA family protein